ncbi:hypothetical protein [Archaeoglobus profundus]|uniref:DUF4062 domain-containing protein n=1 Tax=Archaeoglobus profundus (strain DSM 5631 / JCM 9629 / NBRC 100127 / Av18) TaxID=572546 RepID=D2REJ4_ARCPA|nr:hypothetical protein [Archaeoglobus profundus]ADB58538.1 hypothetical protein Arcpr_1491 [Archaeoglobus profundus DSM 5631]
MDDFNKRYKSKEERSILKYKDKLKIGIFGSFAGDRFKKLESLKNYLKKKGYTNVRLSTDFEKEFPREPDESKVEYNRRLSEIIIDWCDVYIFVFFREEKYPDDVNLNQSASMELERVYTLYKDKFNNGEKFLIIYSEKKCRDQMRSVFKGLAIRETKSGIWEWEEFENIGDIFENASRFCFRCLRKMFGGFREAATP